MDDGPRQLLVLVNPMAGSFRRAKLDEVLRHLHERGIVTEIRLTSRAGEIEEICAAPELTGDGVVVFGGDGTISEAIGGFERAERALPLGIVPFGTANVLARELKLPRRPESIAAMLAGGRIADLHYGLANGRPFTLMVSAGIDAAVVHALSPELKRRFGPLAYAIKGFKAGLAHRGSDLIVTADNRTTRCRIAVVTNGALYGGPFVVCPPAHVLRPGLFLVTLKSDDRLSLIRYSAALLSGRLSKADGVAVRPVERVRIEASTDAPIAAQLDGDAAGFTPLEVEQSPRTMPIFIP